MAATVETPSYWQIKCSEVRQRTSQLYQLGQWTDCVFRVGAEAASVSAHRLVLAIASPVFEAMFYGALAHKDHAEPIDVPDMQVEAFRALLRYIYTDKITITSYTVAYELYNLGQKYMLPKLQSESLQYLKTNLTPDNVGFTYEFAQLFDQEQLADQCLEVIKNDTLKVLKSDSFMELQIDTVVKIFTLEPLNIDSELNLYDAAVLYTTYLEIAKDLKLLKNKVVYKPVDKTNTVAAELREPDANGTETEDKNSTAALTTNEEDLNDKIGEAEVICKCNHTATDKGDLPELPLRKAVKHIRFLAMDLREFSDHDFSLFLSHFEILAILLNLTSKTTHAPMPTGFSTNRKSRIKIDKDGDAENNTIVFRTMVNNVSSIKDHESPIQNVQDLTCQLKTRIRSKEDRKKIGLYLYCNWKDKSTWSCRLQVTAKLLSNRIDTSPVRREFDKLYGNPGHTNWGSDDFIPWDELMDPENGYVTHDSIIWQVEIRARDVKREVTSTTAAPNP